MTVEGAECGLQAKLSEAIQAVMQRGDFVLGQALAEFETAFANACGVKFGIGVASGREAIALGLQAIQAHLAQGEGDRAGIHYPIPCHLQPAYQHLGYKTGDFQVSETLSQQILSLPIYPGLSHSQISHVISAIESLISRSADFIF